MKAVGINAAQHLSVAGTNYYTLLFLGNTSGPGSLLTTSCPNRVAFRGPRPCPRATRLRRRPPIGTIEAGAEVAQERGFFHDAHAADASAVAVDLENCFDHVIDVALRINAAGNRQSQKFVLRCFAKHH